jgi:hypothetical protein
MTRPTPNTGGRWEGAQPKVAWAAETLLDVTPAETFIFAWRGVPVLRQGILPPQAPQAPPTTLLPSGGGGGTGSGGGGEAGVQQGQQGQQGLGSGPIATRAAAEGFPVYLPALQQLPGRVEFTSEARGGWVPANTQALVVAAVGAHGTLLLGSGKARAFTQTDLEKAFFVAQPLARAMEDAEETAAGAAASS